MKRILADLNAYYSMPVTSGYGNSGTPDFLVCYRGRFVAIECKANGGKPTALQLKHIKDIQECGGIAMIVDETNINQLHETLRSYDDNL